MKLFPSGLAMGSAFCNRVLERDVLSTNISNVTHTVIMAPRRYGKSSLIKQVLSENDFDFSWVDFLSVTSKEDALAKISKGANQLLFKLSPELKKIQKQASDFVRSMSPEMSLSFMGQSLTLHLPSGGDSSIEDTLLHLDEYAQKTGKKAVLIFDEFQQLTEVKDNLSVEAMIRHAVERSQAITYIFSGSNRHLLHEMFGQSTRPLYRLCKAMTIERIESKDYVIFLQKAALEKWGASLDEKVLDKIFFYSEFHPFYLNAICEILWSKKEIPSCEYVDEAWGWYVANHKNIITSDLINLSINQKKVLQSLADGPVKEPYSAEFSNKTKLSLSSIKQSVASLVSKDIIFKNANEEYQILDPAILYYFRNF